ncbi:MAG: class I SAM-dependent methyltransferase [Desulfobacterales bacterium]
MIFSFGKKGIDRYLPSCSKIKQNHKVLFLQPIKRAINWILKKFFQLIPAKLRRSIAESCIRFEVHEPAKDALSFLLNLDSLIYQITGFKSIDYNGGRHIKHRVTGYHDFFVTRVKPDERVIDIGCGKGEVAYEIATKAGGSVLGIDYNEQWLNSAKQNYQHPKLEFILEDAEQYIPHVKFDTVILSNVLEHIEDRVSFLQKVNRHVHPDRFLIRVPLFNRDWRVPLKKELGLPYLLDDTHCTEYTQESFEQEMVGAGLSVNHLEIRWGEIWAEVIPDA